MGSDVSGASSAAVAAATDLQLRALVLDGMITVQKPASKIQDWQSPVLQPFLGNPAPGAPLAVSRDDQGHPIVVWVDADGNVQSVRGNIVL